MLNNNEFVKRLLDVMSYRTCYAKGTFGQCATNSFINNKAKQYPGWYTDKRVQSLKALSDDTRLFDCVGLIKGVIWGFPNAVYTSNGLKDVSDQGIWDISTDKSTDFKNILPGELLWIKGHVGVYIGEGKAIECTTAWTGKVQITAVSNIGTIQGYNSRKWTGHAKLPVVAYENAPNSNGTSKPDYFTYPVLKKGSTGEYVKILQRLLLDKGYDPKGVDGKFGTNTLKAVKNFQANNTDVNGQELIVDGKVGNKTWGSLYK